ncbi:MAG: succinate dehydrogenase iron-sulfur subunit [Dehalococcoidia bacterium]
MQAKLKVRRFNPETDGAPYYQDFQVEVDENETVLDALIRVREYQDGTLALRCSCRSAICGSCVMRVNGHAVLACNTKLADASRRDQKVLVEPAGNTPIIKDLVVDIQPFWDSIRGVTPWLMPQGPPPEHEYIVPNASMLALNQVMGCIMCGACVSDCTVLEVDKRFLGPAALAKALRFVGDPRDDSGRDRLKKLTKVGGIWDCTHCFECVQVCPKGVAPMEQILELRRQAVDAGYTNHNGVRHADSFAKSVKHSGALNETKLAVESYGYFNIPALLSLIPTGLRALKARKLPPLHHHKRPGHKNVTRIFEKLEKKR